VTPTRRNRLILSAAGALVLLAAAYSAGWQVLVDRWRAGIAAWTEAQSASGRTVSTGAIAVSGFPLALRLTLAEPRAKDAAGNEWVGPPLTMTVTPFRPLEPEIDAPGTHHLTLVGHAPVEISAATLTGRLTVERGKPVALNAVAGTVVGMGMTLEGLTVDVSRPHVEPGAAPDAASPIALTAVIGLDRLTLPEDLHLPFDRTVASAHLALRLRGTFPTGPVVPALTAWRDGGGTIEIDSIDLNWPPLSLAGEATIALDGALQPEFAGTIRLRGAVEAVDRAQAAGMVDKDAATVTKLALRLATQRTADGAKETKIAIGIQNRVLSVGPVPLLQMPEVTW